MRLLVTTHARLYKTPDGLYYAPLIYDYCFFKRYLRVFETVRIMAHVEGISNDEASKMLLVSGPNLEVAELPFPHGKWNYIKGAISIQKSIGCCFNGCDAVLFRLPDIMAFQAFIVARRKHIPIALEVVADPLVLYDAKGGRYPFRMFLKWFEYLAQRKCCEKADCVSFVTKYQLQKVYPTRIKPKSNRFESHYTSAGIERHNTIERKYPINKTIRLIHVATSISGRNKGHKELIEAFIALRKQGYDINLTLVGGGELDKDIRENLFSSGEFNNVVLAGTLNKEQLSQHYKDADLLVFPSYREGLPRVVIEAMSWGLPCIASDIPGCRELLNEKYLARVCDTMSLLSVMKTLLDNPEQMREESLRNIHEAEKYSSDVIESVRDEYYGQLKKLSIRKC